MVITILVFVLVRGGREVSARIVVDVEAIPPGPAASRILMTEVPEAVTLRLQGSPGVVQQLDADEIPPLSLDLREERDGAFRIDTSAIRLPPGIEVRSVRPASISLHYEPRRKRIIRVLPVVGGQVATAHHVKDPVVSEPSQVTLSGPRSELRDHQEARTELINVEGLGPGIHKRQVLLERPPPNSRYEGTDQVSVTIVIEPDLIERTFVDIGVQVRGTELINSAESVSVTVRGPPSLVESINSEEITAFVDVTEHHEIAGSYRAEVQVEGLDEALEVTLNPATIIVVLEREAATGPGNEDNAPGVTNNPTKTPQG